VKIWGTEPKSVFLLVDVGTAERQAVHTMASTKRSAENLSQSIEEENQNENGSHKQLKQQHPQRKKCPYLDTIRPQMLDFDFEKVCSITLSNQNAYACLVCGKYFQGRGPSTHAYTHALQSFHHVFINLTTDKIYCLPDNYEVSDLSLEPIKLALRPTFSREQIRALDVNRKLAQDSFGVSYLPGFVGLNNLKKTDYISVVLHALAHVPPLRDYFMEPQNYAAAVTKTKSQLVVRFGEIMRKMWSPYNIKNTVIYIYMYICIYATHALSAITDRMMMKIC
jgi:U4/U6.U5 tri-snRNP-associated protein 2